MSTFEVCSWSPLHGYALVLLFGVALSVPLLLASRAAGARVEVVSAGGTVARPAEPRTVSLQGTAEVLTSPDEVTISFRIETFDRSLKAAKTDNDEKAKKALQLLASQGIPAGSVQTGEFSIHQRMEGSYERRVMTGYDVVKRITVSRCDIARAERLLQELFEGSANVLEGVTFSPSQIREKRNEARKLAVQAAQQKAELMASELGQKLGRPLRIEEVTEAPFRHGGIQSNIMVQNDSTSADTSTLAAGKTKVQATVAVVFELL